jgi:hypothetical protein
MRILPKAVVSSQLLVVRKTRQGLALALLLAAVPAQAADCIPFTDAPKKIDETVCVTGKVVKVNSSGRSGTMFINFCDDYRKCAFSVVVFAKDLEKVGDVRALEGKTIEIHGKIKEYRGQAEMVLEDAKQLSGPVTKLPTVPKNYDVENQGKYSPGQYATPKKPDPGKKSPDVAPPSSAAPPK